MKYFVRQEYTKINDVPAWRGGDMTGAADRSSDASVGFPRASWKVDPHKVKHFLSMALAPRWSLQGAAAVECKESGRRDFLHTRVRPGQSGMRRFFSLLLLRSPPPPPSPSVGTALTTFFRHC